MILIGLGGNLPHPDYGPPENTLEAALERLSDRGVHVAARSRWYVTPPFPPSISPQPWYVNGAVTIEPVYCLGLCANGPAAMIGDKVVGALDEAKLERVISEAGA